MTKIKAKIQEWLTVENLVDITVDLLLVAFDTLAAPILIPLRMGKFVLRKWTEDFVKFPIAKGIFKRRESDKN